MSHDMIDRVRLLAPPAEVSETGRTEQRWKLEHAIAAETALRSPAETPSSGRRCRVPRSHRRAYLAWAAASIVAAAGVAVPLSLGAGSPAVSRANVSGAPVMQIGSYRLRLPSSYRLTSADASGCQPFVVAKSSDSQVVHAANASDKCLYMETLPPYTPSGGGDPDTSSLPDEQKVKVNQYDAQVGTTPPASVGGSAVAETTTLYVEVPVAGGQIQDLVVSAAGLSPTALVTLVAKGLSVGGVPGIAGNTGGNAKSGAAGNSGTSDNTGTATTS